MRQLLDARPELHRRIVAVAHPVCLCVARRQAVAPTCAEQSAVGRKDVAVVPELLAEAEELMVNYC